MCFLFHSVWYCRRNYLRLCSYSAIMTRTPSKRIGIVFPALIGSTIFQYASIITPRRAGYTPAASSIYFWVLLLGRLICKLYRVTTNFSKAVLTFCIHIVPKLSNSLQIWLLYPFNSTMDSLLDPNMTEIRLQPCPSQRKRIQNRMAQRKFRESIRILPIIKDPSNILVSPYRRKS